MNKYYCKLKPIDVSNYANVELLGTQYICAGTLSKYSHVNIDSSIIVPKEFKDQFFMTHLAMRGKIIPHRDQGIRCKINIYLSDNNATTRFYTSADPSTFKEIAKDCNGCDFEKFTSGNCACSLKTTNLELADSFAAKTNDIYLINTTEIHSVEELSPENPRFVLNLTTNLSYEDTYDMLKEHGLLDV